MMEAEFNHLNHATWEYKYHVVFTPKYRKKRLFGKIKRHLGQAFHDLARRKECRIEEGHLMPDHVHGDIDTPQIFGGADHRIHEREEFDMDVRPGKASMFSRDSPAGVEVRAAP
jgi:putative transposase